MTKPYYTCDFITFVTNLYYTCDFITFVTIYYTCAFNTPNAIYVNFLLSMALCAYPRVTWLLCATVVSSKLKHLLQPPPPPPQAITNFEGKKVTAILSLRSSRGLGTPEVKTLAFYQCDPGSIPGRGVIWAEFVGSPLCSERFFSGYSGFPLSSKSQHLILFDLCWFDFLKVL